MTNTEQMISSPISPIISENIQKINVESPVSSKKSEILSSNNSSRVSSPIGDNNSGYSSPISSLLSGGERSILSNNDDYISDLNGGGNEKKENIIDQILDDDNFLSIDGELLYGNTRNKIFENISSVSEIV